MHSSSIIATAAALISSAQAAILYVDNYCNFPIYLRTSSSQSGQSRVFTLPSNTINAYNETLRGPGYTQNALTISTTPTLAYPLQMGYTQTTNPPAPGLTYYDLSTVFGDPFMAQGFQLVSGGNGFDIVCPPRTAGDCPNTWSPSNPGGNDALFSQSDADGFALRLCHYYP